MEIEGKTVVWLTSLEVEIACRNYARKKMEAVPGHAISATARVSGLDKLIAGTKRVVSVLVVHSTEEVK